MGKKTIENAEQLEKHIDKFIEMCQREEVEPTDYILTEFLGVSVSTLDRFRRGEGTYTGYDEPLKKLTAYREHRLLSRLNDPATRNATPLIFQLKQPKNGGYQDVIQQVQGGDMAITLKVEGVGGADAFK